MNSQSCCWGYSKTGAGALSAFLPPAVAVQAEPHYSRIVSSAEMENLERHNLAFFDGRAKQESLKHTALQKASQFRFALKVAKLSLRS